MYSAAARSFNLFLQPFCSIIKWYEERRSIWFGSYRTQSCKTTGRDHLDRGDMIRCPPSVRSLFTGSRVEFVRQKSMAALSESINELKYECQEGTKAVLVRAGFVSGSIGLEI